MQQARVIDAFRQNEAGTWGGVIDNKEATASRVELQLVLVYHSMIGKSEEAGGVHSFHA